MGKSVFVAMAALGLIASFQNCSNVSFTKVESSQAIIPLCHDISDPEVTPRLKWDWFSQLSLSPGEHYSNFSQVMSAPMVGDLDGNGVPEVVFTSFSTNSADLAPDAISSDVYRANGVLRVVDGATGFTKFSVGNWNLAPYASTSPLLMDIDGDGKMEIFYVHYTGRYLIALNNDGSLRWRFALPANMIPSFAGLTGSDVNHDGIGEILVGGYLVSEDGAHRPYAVITLPDIPTFVTTTLVMPLNPKHPEDWSIISPNGIFKKDGTTIASLPGGILYFAAADLYPEIEGVEIVATGGGWLRIFNGLTGAVIKSVDLSIYNSLKCPSGIGGGPPTIGNFDGESATLQIAVATGRYLTIFNREGVPLYKSVTQDCSSLMTGITSFDLNGDKKPEILYGDEEYFRIYEVQDGELKVVYSTPNPSGTLMEYPLVVDLTGHHSADIVLASNNYAVDGFYKDSGEQNDGLLAKNITGVRAFEASGDVGWMPTRPIWNQYSFHPDLVTDAGRFISAPVMDNTIFRRNNQGYNTTLSCQP